jgi:hypothetical protein
MWVHSIFVRKTTITSPNILLLFSRLLLHPQLTLLSPTRFTGETISKETLPKAQYCTVARYSSSRPDDAVPVCWEGRASCYRAPNVSCIYPASVLYGAAAAAIFSVQTTVVFVSVSARD